MANETNLLHYAHRQKSFNQQHSINKFHLKRIHAYRSDDNWSVNSIQSSNKIQLSTLSINSIPSSNKIQLSNFQPCRIKSPFDSMIYDNDFWKLIIQFVET